MAATVTEAAIASLGQAAEDDAGRNIRASRQAVREFASVLVAFDEKVPEARKLAAAEAAKADQATPDAPDPLGISRSRKDEERHRRAVASTEAGTPPSPGWRCRRWPQPPARRRPADRWSLERRYLRDRLRGVREGDAARCETVAQRPRTGDRAGRARSGLRAPHRQCSPTLPSRRR